MQHKVLLIDRSAVMRRELGRLIAAAPDLRLIAAVPDVHCAVLRAQVDLPDVLVLDVAPDIADMRVLLHAGCGPRTTGVVVLADIDAQAAASGAAPVSAYDHAGHQPARGTPATLAALGPRVLDSIRRAAAASRQHGADDRGARDDHSPFGPAIAPAPCLVHVAPKLSADVVLPPPPPPPHHHATTMAPIVAIGTSTGGTQALETVLSALPADAPPIVIVQHMPERFTAAFASRLDGQCAIEVREARHHDRVTRGCALIAPGGRHMLLRASGAHYHVEIVDAPPVNRHRPSVDVLFRSVASVAERNALGIIMTGMGDDGAVGLREMRAAGARTLAQDEASCAVYGMPREAVRLGGVEASMSLDALAAAIKAHH